MRATVNREVTGSIPVFSYGSHFPLSFYFFEPIVYTVGSTPVNLIVRVGAGIDTQWALVLFFVEISIYSLFLLYGVMVTRGTFHLLLRVRFPVGY